MNVYGLIGNPLGHSFSKQYFTGKFEKEQLKDCCFELYPLEDIQEFTSLLHRVASLKGLAVTIPYKETVIPFLDHIDETASLIAAVNCIKISAGKLTGYNTDSIGFERSLVPLLQSHHKRALILGSGGSSRAVQFVLKKLGIDFLVVTRNNKPADGFIHYDAVDKHTIGQYPLIINCTPVGMFPNEADKPSIPYPYLNKDHLLFDLIYRPAETSFLAEGLRYGAAVKNGYEMLVIQAEENWKIWNG